MRRGVVLLLSLWLLLSAFSFAVARPEADSVILFIGDGMGPNAIELTRTGGRRFAPGDAALPLLRPGYHGVRGG